MSEIIRVENLNKRYNLKGEDLHILKGIDLSIKKEEMLAIVGPSGAGKSTLLHIMGTLDAPTEGKVYFNGMDLFAQTEEALARFRNKKLGFVFQFHHLLPEFTALENTIMPALIHKMDKKEALQRGEGILKEVGLSERINHRPGELSGGEQQRVAVARALILSPEVILADEPTGNLDTHTSDAVFSLILRLNKERGITFVIVTHNEKLASQADRIVRMVDGRIV